MSSHHAKLIRTIFHDPPSGNIHWRDVQSLLVHLGADLESLSGTRVRVKLNHMETVLSRPHHSNVLNIGAIGHLRAFLARAGVTPSLYESEGGHKPAS